MTPRRARGRGPRTLHLVSLGCPKNRVDSEVMLGVASERGLTHVDDPAEADVIVVNTCGFIDAARRESVDTILELAQWKERGRCSELVVTGCLVQRHADELARELPEVDHLLGSSDALALSRVLAGDAPRLLVGSPADWVIRASDPRRLTTRGASAWVKLAEGCDRRCSFCTIPTLRGRQRSRAADDVVREVERLAAGGVLEVNLVSQDTVAYGRDREDGARLAPLVERIAEVPGLRWVRLFYLYPERLDDALLELLGGHPRVLPYVDMPLQHAADSMLRRMRRGHGGRRQRELIERVRRRVPEVTFRSAFIVGHPGEGEAEFEELLAFLRWAELDHVGVFRYSPEEGTPSASQDAQVPARAAAGRARRLMTVQRKISRAKCRALVGRELEVLIDGPSEESELVLEGRHAGQAPEVDGVVYVGVGHARPGELHRVRITQSTDHDLAGEVIDAPPPEARPSSPRPRASRGRRLPVVVG
ncbi:MAG: 30S ribosomal protein S12 methylthiotransferase RimO [Polyangiaceae bacterium]|nr:30S ribosomal protein S12 methylthiotransferase RimO [Polyangiaceae bacterium]